MACQICGIQGPTHNIKLHYNVGMVFARKTYTINGDLCKVCIYESFKAYQVKNLTLGWWGQISFFMTWYYLVANTVQYAKARSLPRPAPGTQRINPGSVGAVPSMGAGYQQPNQSGAVSQAPLGQQPTYLGTPISQPASAQSFQQAPTAPSQALTQDTISRMQPVAAEYWSRLCQGEPIDTLAPIMGRQAIVDAYQAWLYGAGMIKAAHDQAAQQQAAPTQSV